MSQRIVVYGWWCCTQEVEKYRWYMLSCCPYSSRNQAELPMIYVIFADFLGVLHTATSFCQKVKKCCQKVKKFQTFCGCLENCRFYRGSAYLVKFYSKLVRYADDNKANTGARCLHITTRNGTSQNRSRPKIINTGKR